MNRVRLARPGTEEPSGTGFHPHYSRACGVFLGSQARSEPTIPSVVPRDPSAISSPDVLAEQAFRDYRRTNSARDLARVVRLTRPRLLALARRLLDDDSAEDAVQDTYLTVMLRGHTFDLERPLGPWLRRVLVSKARDVQRLSKRHGSSRAVDIDALAGELDHLQGGMMRKLFRRGVREAARCLGPSVRRVLWLRFVIGLDSEAIAAALGENGSTVRMRISRALARMRPVLRAFEEGF
jgi:RNA polymerase sigma factor (sigma-70 family)